MLLRGLIRESPQLTGLAECGPSTFGVQTARERAVYNPLDTAQWEFYVLPHPALATVGTDSVSLGAVRAAAGPPVPYPALVDCIRSADPRPGTTTD